MNEQKRYKYTDGNGNTNYIELYNHGNIGTSDLVDMGIIQESPRAGDRVRHLPFCGPLADLYDRLDAVKRGERKHICGND